MKINFHKIEIEQPSTMSLQEFADKHDCTLEIYERFSTNLPISTYYIACLDRIQYPDGSIPLSYLGSGLDETTAVQKHVELISGEELVFNSGNAQEDKPEIVKVPNLTFSGL